MTQTSKQIAVLGISAFYHDSAAALVVDGEIVAAAHEERFTRKKHDDSFPTHAVQYVLREAGFSSDDLSAVVFYDKPILKFERLLETYHATAPRGVVSFVAAMPVWIKQKFFTRRLIREGIEEACAVALPKGIPILFPEHHISHAASAFYPSPFEEAAILTIDGVGEWATTTIGKGAGGEMEMLKEMHFPHSLGLLYSAFTYYCGFKINSGEYKLMGLAPYGEKRSARAKEYKKKIKENLLHLKADGSLFLNMKYFTFATQLRTVDDEKWTELFGISPRDAESELTQEYMDLALAIQEITEEIVVLMAKTARKETGMKNLVMAGGVALNCVANVRILEEKIFENIWIQPAAGDAGGALGAALLGYYVYFGKPRIVQSHDAMRGSYLGPAYSDEDVMRMTRSYGAVHTAYADFDSLVEEIAEKIADGNVVGWMQGRIEWGPRALGNRSILADPRNAEMQKKLNLKIKYREGFRPFAPSVLESYASEYFDMGGIPRQPYMLFTAPVIKSRRKPLLKKGSMLERLNSPRSDIPSVTHLDYSSRVQTVSADTNERYAKLIEAFRKHTGCGLLINTSFNVRGEPIVCTPEDAYKCFMNTEMDYLVIGNLLFDKKSQPERESHDIKESYGLD